MYIYRKGAYLMIVNQQAGRTILGILGLLLFIFAAGYEVIENERTGLPMLRKKK